MVAENLRVIEGGRADDGADDPLPPPLTGDVDLEDNVVGNAVYQPDVLADLAAFLRPEHFESERNRRVYEAALTLRSRGVPVDGTAVLHELRQTDRLAQVGGAETVIALGANMPVTTRANVLEHARRVRDLYVRRRQRDLGRRMTARAEYDGALVSEQIAAARDTLDELAAQLTAGEVQGRVDAVADKVLADLLADAPPGRGVLRTGFASIDRFTSGLPIDLAVIAGMPGEAKTSLTNAIAVNVARAGGGVLIISLETTRDEMFRRMVAAEAKISMQRAVAEELTAAEIGPFIEATKALRPLPIYFEDGDMQARHIYARGRAVQLALAREKRKLALVVVDYLQLIKPEKAGREERHDISDAAKALKSIAVDLRVPVLAVSQVNEAKVEERKPPRPKVGDLFGSSMIRKCARLILGLYRPDARPTGKNYQPTGIAEVEVLKNNKGPAGGVAELRFHATSASFSDDVPPPPAASTYVCGGCGCRNEVGVSCRCGKTQTPPPPEADDDAERDESFGDWVDRETGGGT